LSAAQGHGVLGAGGRVELVFISENGCPLKRKIVGVYIKNLFFDKEEAIKHYRHCLEKTVHNWDEYLKIRKRNLLHSKDRENRTKELEFLYQRMRKSVYDARKQLECRHTV